MENKIVVITGGSRGLGKNLAQLLISKKAKVVISSRDEKELIAAAAEIGATPILADVTQEIDLANLAAKTVTQFGRIDIWINDAGIWLPHGPFDEADLAKAHQIFEVNVFGTIYGSKAAAIQMKLQRAQSMATQSTTIQAGTIVNIVSTSGLAGRPNSALYAASKFADRGFTESIQEELKDAGINVIAVYPGGMKTNLFDVAKPADYDTYMEPSFVAQKIIENLEKQIPEGELIIRRPQ